MKKGIVNQWRQALYLPRVGKGRKNRPRLDNNLLTPAGRVFANATWRSVRTLPVQRCWFTFPRPRATPRFPSIHPSLNQPRSRDRPIINHSVSFFLPFFRSKLFSFARERTSEICTTEVRIFFQLHPTSSNVFSIFSGWERETRKFCIRYSFFWLKASLKSLARLG